MTTIENHEESHDDQEECEADESSQLIPSKQPIYNDKHSWNKEIYYSAFGLLLMEILVSMYGIYVLSNKSKDLSKQYPAAICALVSSLITILISVLGMMSSARWTFSTKLLLTRIYLMTLILMMIAQNVAVSTPLFVHQFNLFALMMILVLVTLFSFNITLGLLRLKEMSKPDFEDDDGISR